MKTEINRFYCGGKDKLHGICQITQWLNEGVVYHLTTIQMSTNRKDNHPSKDMFVIRHQCGYYDKIDGKPKGIMGW